MSDIPIAPASQASPCLRHPERLADELCQRCGDFICVDCLAQSGGEKICPDCISKMPSQGGVPAGTEWSVGGIFNQAVKCTMGVFLPCFLLSVLPQVLSLIPNLAMQGFMAPGAMPPDLEPLVWVAVGVGVMFAIILFIWIQCRVLASVTLVQNRFLLQGKSSGIVEALAMSQGHVWPLVLTWLAACCCLIPVYIVSAIVIGVSAVAFPPLAILTVPIVAVVVAFIVLRWSMTIPITILGRSSGFEPLKQSWLLVKGDTLMVFVNFLVMVLAIIALAIPVGILSAVGSTWAQSGITPAVMGISLASAILGAALGVFQMAYILAIYHGLLLRKGAYSSRRPRAGTRPVNPAEIPVARSPEDTGGN